MVSLWHCEAKHTLSISVDIGIPLDYRSLVPIALFGGPTVMHSCFVLKRRLVAANSAQTLALISAAIDNSWYSLQMSSSSNQQRCECICIMAEDNR